MPNIDGIAGYNSPSGINKLHVAYGNDVIDVLTGLGYGLNLTGGNKAFFETFLDTQFFVNGSDKMRAFYNGAWSDSISLPKQIIPKYIRKSVNNAQLLIGNCVLTPGSGTPINYKSYVFKSDFPRLGKSPTGSVISQTIQWGIESGRCTVSQDTKKLKAVPDGNGRLPYFKSRGIKVGDPVFLLGGDIGQYSVASVDSEYELTINEAIPSATSVNTSIDFWVGDNFFPVGTDDNDEIKGFGENNSRDLIFKLFSLWYYTGTQLKQVKGAPGTSSQRSVINDNRGNTYYFHGSDVGKTGIYRYDGVQSTKISRAVDPFIAGMLASNYSEVVAWAEGDELRFFLGDLTNNNDQILMTNAVATINTATQAWDISPIADIIKCAAQFISSNVQNSYCGTNNAEVMRMNTGFTHNGIPIPAVVETGIVYPSGSQIQNEYPYIQAIGKNVRGVILKYKLWNAPTAVDDRWESLGELKDDLTEFEPPTRNRIGAGIQFRVEEDGSLENNWLFEKISLFYKPDRTRLLE